MKYPLAYSHLGGRSILPRLYMTPSLIKHTVWALQQVTYATDEGLLPEAERMRQLARDCKTELQEIDAIETYRKDEKRAVHIHIQARE